MARLPAVKAAEHRNALEKMGFSREPTGKEEKWVLEHEGKCIRRTSVPHGRDDIKPGTMTAILNRQLYLHREEYRAFYDCTWRGKNLYVTILEKKGRAV